MLSRRGSSEGARGEARGGAGDRLRAALAGLQELHLLRDRQGHMVSWALGLDWEEPVSSVPSEQEGAVVMGAEEQRLEETLTSLKQQLVRSWTFHFYLLDQHSRCRLVLQLKPSVDPVYTSKPSAGFYVFNMFYTFIIIIIFIILL